jgi:hypothetical protein
MLKSCLGDTRGIIFAYLLKVSSHLAKEAGNLPPIKPEFIKQYSRYQPAYSYLYHIPIRYALFIA